MKFLVFTLTLISCSILYAQETKNKEAPFVRVYDLNGKKISKGRIASLTNTSLVVGPREKPVNIEVTRIGFIKTKRSAGNNILWGAAIGAGTGVILGVSSGDTGGGFFSYSKEEGGAAYGIGMMSIGAAIGAITILFKKPLTFPIDGDLSKWKAFKEAMGE
jgi:hypothetical protein